MQLAPACLQGAAAPRQALFAYGLGRAPAPTLANLLMPWNHVLALPLPLPQALRYALWFYDAQRSGALPRPYRVSWRNSSHPSDAVVGGYYDAGDFIKHSLTTAQASTFLAWAALDFVTGFNASELQTGTIGWVPGRARARWARFLALHCWQGCVRRSPVTGV